MAYTPPAYNLVDVTWQGDATYTPPAYNSVNYDPSESSGAFTITSSSTFAAVGFQAGVNEMAFSVTANASLSYLIEGWNHAVAAFTSTSTLSGAGRKIDPREFALVGTGAFTPQLGYGVASAFSISASTTLDGVSSVGQGAFSFSSETTTNLVGAWDGTSGGNFFLAPTSELSAIGQSTAEATTSIDATSSLSSDARAVWAVEYSITDAPTLSATGARILPTAYNMIMMWDIAPTLDARSAFESPTTYTISGSTATSFSGALQGDATFTISGQTTPSIVGVAETTAPLTFSVTSRSRARFYSADGRDNKFIISSSPSASFVGDYTIAPHAVAAAYSIGGSTQISAAGASTNHAAFAIYGTSLFYSYRGESYDESDVVTARVLTAPKERMVFIPYT